METAIWEEYVRYQEEQELISRSRSADKAVAREARRQMKKAGLDPQKQHIVYLASGVKKTILESLRIELEKNTLLISSILEKTQKLWSEGVYTIRDSFNYAEQLETLLAADTKIEVLRFITKRFETLPVEEWDTLSQTLREWLIACILQRTTGTRSINGYDALQASIEAAVYKAFLNCGWGQWSFMIATLAEHRIRIYNDLQEVNPAAAGMAAGKQEATDQE